MKETVLDIFTMFRAENKDEFDSLVGEVCIRIGELGVSAVVDVSGVDMSDEDLGVFVPCIETAAQKNVSFVVVGRVGSYVGDFPIVPTMKEAEDYIAMEDMQRMLLEDF